MYIAITILLTVLMFGLLILVHETGHFIAAKLFGVRVNEFSLGMGPRLFGFGRGETKYNIRALPIGGYVSMEGEETDTEDPRGFRRQKVWKRMVICVAGVFMNFLLGFLIAVLLVAVPGSKQLAGTTVAGVVPGAQVGGLQEGDRIVSISGYRIFVGEDISFGISRSDPTGKSEITQLETRMVVLRDGQRLTLNDFHPFTRVSYEDGTQEDRYSFYVRAEKKNFFSVLRHGFFESLSYIRTTYLGLSDLLTGRIGIDSLGSVVRIGQVVGKVAKSGMPNLFYLMALISVNLGVMNLLPIPALDGGRLVLLLFEGLFRRKINGKVEYALIAGSMILLYLLVFLVTVKDIITIF